MPDETSTANGGSIILQGNAKGDGGSVKPGGSAIRDSENARPKGNITGNRNAVGDSGGKVREGK